jgi:hypothetical protein
MPFGDELHLINRLTDSTGRSSTPSTRPARESCHTTDDNAGAWATCTRLWGRNERMLTATDT